MNTRVRFVSINGLEGLFFFKGASIFYKSYLWIWQKWREKERERACCRKTRGINRCEFVCVCQIRHCEWYKPAISPQDANPRKRDVHRLLLTPKHNLHMHHGDWWRRDLQSILVYDVKCEQLCVKYYLKLLYQYHLRHCSPLPNPLRSAVWDRERRRAKSLRK